MADVRGWDPEKQVERQHEKAATDDIISKSLGQDVTASETTASVAEIAADELWDQLGQVYETVCPSRHGFNRLDVLRYLVDHEGTATPHEVADEYNTDVQSVHRWVSQFEDVTLVDTTGTPTPYAEILLQDVEQFGADLYDLAAFEELLHEEIFDQVPERLAAAVDGDETVAAEIAEQVATTVSVESPETNPLDTHIPYDEIGEYLDAIHGDRLKPFLVLGQDHTLSRRRLSDLLDHSEYTVENWIRNYREAGLMATTHGDYAPTAVGDQVLDMATEHYADFQQAATRRKRELEADPYIDALDETG